MLPADCCAKLRKKSIIQSWYWNFSIVSDFMMSHGCMILDSFFYMLFFAPLFVPQENKKHDAQQTNQ